MKTRDSSSIFVENVTKRLEEQKLYKRNLAQQVGVSEPTMNRMLKEGANPELNTIARIAAALGIRPWQLLQPEEDKSLAEKIIPPEFVEKIAKLSEEDRRLFFANTHIFLTGLKLLSDKDKEAI